ncbi:hypothetical protein [Oleiagrimonas sp. C23AA]|uniref:hypothetical protein n=1 Tax=Oleiagrimonas sp. C23AA TaxID=2719047 RepID=UPI001420A433|nr:hypothetical protein [Oleiagrimonas sp. C23AA]NII09674.1 hypothetical protein [Oleiagrimonas sp. C23AA]
MSTSDLTAWTTVADVVRDLAVSGAAVFSATIAWRGLNRWKQEQTGKVQFEVARQLARATNKYRNAINDARAVVTLAAEFPKDYDAANHTDEEEAAAWGHVFNNRFSQLRDAAVELQTIGLEAEVLWGEEAKRRVDALIYCVSKLRIGMESRLRQYGDGSGRRPYQNEAIRKNDDIVFGSTEFTDVENPFTEEVKAKLNDMQDFLKAHLSEFRAKG